MSERKDTTELTTFFLRNKLIGQPITRPLPSPLTSQNACKHVGWCCPPGIIILATFLMYIETLREGERKEAEAKTGGYDVKIHALPVG